MHGLYRYCESTVNAGVACVETVSVYADVNRLPLFNSQNGQQPMAPYQVSVDIMNLKFP
jgi:hypothetical protein